MLVRGDVSITAEDRTEQMLRNREKVLGTLNKAALVLLTRREESFETAMSDGLDLVAEIAEISRMSVFRNIERPSGLHLSQIYRWRKDADGLVGVWPQLNDVPYSAFAPQLKKILESGECINGSVDALPNNEMFKRFGCVTVLVIPVFDEGKFWGLTLFEKIRDEDFSESDADVLRAASAMLATAVIHNEESKMMRLANEQSQLMLDAAPFAITMWDKNFNVVDCSQAALDVFGYSSKQELMERFVCDAPEYQPCGRRSMEILAEAATEAFQTGSCHLEWTGRAANGEPTIFQDIAVRVKYKGDYALMLYSRDIWEEKKAQEELARRDEMLVAQAHWYQSVLDGIPLPLSVSDTDMNLTFVNKAAENCFDKKREELLGRPCHNWNASICRTDNCSIVRARRGEKQTFFKHNGSSYQVVSEILTDLAGHTAGHIETLQDVTEAENMARLQADTENKAKSTFLATMSHEMRTPLNAVIGMTAIGRRSAEIERKNYALDRIEEASSHLLGVINDILDMSKIEAGKLELSPLEYSFEKMLQKVVTVINHRVHEKQQRFSVNIDGSVPRFVIGDDQRLAQIIANLLSNAVKFTLEGGEISLNVSLLGEENGLCEIRFEVADSGIGISAAQQKKLFSAFSQAGRDTTRSFGGTGLGLAISKQLVEMMGGKIWVESKPGNGSRFIFTVKVPLGVTNPRSLLRPGVAWEKLRVLAVDGSGATRQHFEDSFERLGVPCHTVANADDARQLIETHGPFDIYFISWRMSGMSGAELARWIKSREDKGAIVLISSADWENLQEAVRDCGADKGLVKPVLSSSLVDCLNELFGNTGESQDHDMPDEFAGKWLLLAEDIEINREIVISLLEGTGIAIDCAENGEAALAMMEANPEKYDIVFMDMQMPVMDGLSATRHIRALPSPRCREVPIIAMTANVFKDDIENCLAAGMNDHIGKPINVDGMLAKLRQHLHVGALTAENSSGLPL